MRPLIQILLATVPLRSQTVILYLQCNTVHSQQQYLPRWSRFFCLCYCFSFTLLQDISTSSVSDSEDISLDSEGSLYLPSPERIVRDRVRGLSIVPSNICFMDLKQLDKFMKQINTVRNCATPGCHGALTRVPWGGVRGR